MPDHAHVLLSGTGDASEVLKAMNMFKQKSGFWLSQNHPHVHWQKDYFDQVIRDDKAKEEMMRYILNNPVKMGIVKHWREYPYKGSTIHQLDTWDM